MSFIVKDFRGNEIKVGSKVLYRLYGTLHSTADYQNYIAEVTGISDPDADYDDELGCAVEIPPHITIRFNSDTEGMISTENVTKITWADYPDGPEHSIYEAEEDIEVLKDA